MRSRGVRVSNRLIYITSLSPCGAWQHAPQGGLSWLKWCLNKSYTVVWFWSWRWLGCSWYRSLGSLDRSISLQKEPLPFLSPQPAFQKHPFKCLLKFRRVLPVCVRCGVWTSCEPPAPSLSDEAPLCCWWWWRRPCGECCWVWLEFPHCPESLWSTEPRSSSSSSHMNNRWVGLVTWHTHSVGKVNNQGIQMTAAILTRGVFQTHKTPKSLAAATMYLFFKLTSLGLVEVLGFAFASLDPLFLHSQGSRYLRSMSEWEKKRK